MLSERRRRGFAPCRRGTVAPSGPPPAAGIDVLGPVFFARRRLHGLGRGPPARAADRAQPPPREVIPVPLTPPTISPVREQPGGVHQLVAPTAGMADPLWGVAGLLLIPATGAILGCRQARAAEAIAKLGRRP